MTITKGALLQPQGMSTVERDLLALAGADTARIIFNETTGTLQLWNGSAWIDVVVSTTVLSDTQLPDPLDGGTY